MSIMILKLSRKRCDRYFRNNNLGVTFIYTVILLKTIKDITFNPVLVIIVLPNEYTIITNLCYIMRRSSMAFVSFML